MLDPQKEKSLGNSSFKEGNFTNAIKHYGNAIKMYPNDPSFYLNRGMAYSKQSNWVATLNDCDFALKLDPKYIKALLLKGKAKIQLGKDDDHRKDSIIEGINYILKAKTLCTGQKKEEFEADLENALLLGRKIEWYKEYEIDNRNHSKSKEIIKNWINQEKEYSIEEKKSLIVQSEKILKDEVPMKSKIPEHLLCELTKEIMTEPVITTEGHTYDKEELEKYISVYGYKDPVTGNQIDKMLIIKNINIKQSLEDFIRINPWSYKYKPSENYKAIEL